MSDQDFAAIRAALKEAEFDFVRCTTALSALDRVEATLRAAEQRAERFNREVALRAADYHKQVERATKAEQRAEQAVKAQLESEEELAGELAEERTLHQQTIRRADRAEKALREIADSTRMVMAPDWRTSITIAREALAALSPDETQAPGWQTDEAGGHALPGGEEEVPWPEQYKGE